MSRHPKKELFSVVIPTLNEGDMLHMTVDSILEQTEYPNYEVLVVDAFVSAIFAVRRMALRTSGSTCSSGSTRFA